MKVSIKDFAIGMEVKSKGVEFDVYDGKEHLGDLIVSQSKLIWCEGRVRRENGKEISWRDFQEFMNSR